MAVYAAHDFLKYDKDCDCHLFADSVSDEGAYYRTYKLGYEYHALEQNIMPIQKNTQKF